MRFAAHLPFSIGFLILAGNGHVISAPLERTVSPSRQFIVYGTTAPLRGAVAEVAETTKAGVLNLLQQRDTWKIPIILNLQFPRANEPEIPPAALRFSQTGSGLKIQLDLTINSDFDVVAVRRQLLRVTLLEMIYRQVWDLPAGSFYVEPPDWLIEGFLAADPNQNRTSIVEAVDALVNDNKVPSLDEFLRQRLVLLDSPGQLLYRAYALAFLHLLLNEPGGSVRLIGYINTLSRASSDPLADLKAQFPVLNGGVETDAAWKRSVANLKTFDYELLTAAETERQLDELVGSGNASSGKPDAINLAEFAKKKKISRSEAAGLRPLKEKLILLGVRANPMLRTVVFEYEQIVERMAARKIKGTTTRLAQVASQRRQIAARIGNVDDYLNWFEATRSDTDSGAFSAYLRAAARSSESHPRRRDPLSVYLDALEEQF